MNILDGIKILSEVNKAMEVGQEIKDPAGWKDKQVLMNKVGVVLVAVSAVAKTAGYELPDGIIEYATEGIAAFMLLANVVLTWSTSKKVGK